MNTCSQSQKWFKRKKFYQTQKLHILISIRESYERKLSAISASISKLEEQINNHEFESDN